MDMKTMEWMEERLKKGKALQEQINILKNQKERIGTTTVIAFTANKGYCNAMEVKVPNGNDFGKNVIKETLEVFQKLAAEEIERLEKEFTEL